MKKSEMSCIYHPTTAVFVDDDISFLKNITLTLDPDIPYKTYQDPKEALKYIKKLKNHKLLLHAISATENDFQDASGDYPINLKVSSIFHEAYDKNQFDEVSVIIVDYSMPKISGAEFFEKIREIPIKKIMLTGQADEAIAVKLFNSGMIDKFLLKGSPDLNEMVNQSIHELQKEYFQDLSNTILKGLPVRQKSCIFDSKFIDLFKKICTDNHISSYYLIEILGSFLLLDDSGQASWLLVSSENEAQEFAQQAEAEGAPQNVIEALKNGEKIAYFGNFNAYVHATRGHWEKYLYNATKLKGKKEFRYALVKDLKGFAFNKNKIFSFNEYMNNTIKK